MNDRELTKNIRTFLDGPEVPPDQAPVLELEARLLRLENGVRMLRKQFKAEAEYLRKMLYECHEHVRKIMDKNAGST